MRAASLGALMPRPRLLLVVVLGLLALAPAAGAASRTQIINDCEDDSKLSGTYSPGELRDARNNIPSDRDAYSDCRDVLSAALAAGARRSAQSGGGAGTGASSGGTGTGTGGVPPGPDAGVSPSVGSLGTAPGAAPPVVSRDERTALRAAREELPEVDVRGQRIVPGVRGVAGEAASATIPTSLVATLALLGVALALAAALFVRRRVLLRRPA